MALIIASACGAGYAPVAPGTVGSLVAAVALWVIPFTPPSLVLLLAVVVVIGTWAASRAERVLERKDPGIIVVDEVAGMIVSVLFLPRTPQVLIAAFFLFRVFDIWKPYPVRASQDLPGGLGVMVDDLLAGLYTLLLLAAARRLLGVPA